MSEPGANLQYAVIGELVWVRVTGRANCVLAAEFLALVQQFRNAGRRRFSLDLRECALMDSSFLGMLGGLEQDLGSGNLQSGEYALELVQASERVAELIRSLGLDEYFKLLSADREFPDQWIPVPPSTSHISHADCSKMSLQAHEVIVQLNPANEPKFRDVMNYLKEDVRRLEEGEGQ
ncbi:MAG: STAS domain-containing protein [Verrucomicrobia bacterium]|nr:STAS domain-containing protein [Verrucomicrobiota bacterium]MBI3869076.1 STAS domain-containing protein [Verrucomicrobiota bacterium]